MAIPPCHRVSAREGAGGEESADRTGKINAQQIHSGLTHENVSMLLLLLLLLCHREEKSMLLLICATGERKSCYYIMLCHTQGREDRPT